MATAKVTAPIQLPSNQLVNTGKPSPQIMLEGISKGLRGGESIRLDLQFANAGVVSMNVPVVTRSREFKDYPPAPSATRRADAFPLGHHRRRGRSGPLAPRESLTPRA